MPQQRWGEGCLPEDEASHILVEVIALETLHHAMPEASLTFGLPAN